MRRNENVISVTHFKGAASLPRLAEDARGEIPVPEAAGTDVLPSPVFLAK